MYILNRLEYSSYTKSWEETERQSISLWFSHDLWQCESDLSTGSTRSNKLKLHFEVQVGLDRIRASILKGYKIKNLTTKKWVRRFHVVIWIYRVFKRQFTTSVFGLKLAVSKNPGKFNSLTRNRLTNFLEAGEINFRNASVKCQNSRRRFHMSLRSLFEINKRAISCGLKTTYFYD